MLGEGIQVDGVISTKIDNNEAKVVVFFTPETMQKIKYAYLSFHSPDSPTTVHAKQIVPLGDGMYEAVFVVPINPVFEKPSFLHVMDDNDVEYVAHVGRLKLTNKKELYA